jgi:hypothetical protein
LRTMNNSPGLVLAMMEGFTRLSEQASIITSGLYTFPTRDR